MSDYILYLQWVNQTLAPEAILRMQIILNNSYSEQEAKVSLWFHNLKHVDWPDWSVVSTVISELGYRRHLRLLLHLHLELLVLKVDAVQI